jgi:hypothetical protein
MGLTLGGACVGAIAGVIIGIIYSQRHTQFQSYEAGRSFIMH